MRVAELQDDDVGGLYDDLAPWAATLCEAGYQDALASGRRRRAARMDFVPGWKEAARQLGRHDVFAAACAGGELPATAHEPAEADLPPWARRALDETYAERERRRGSREAFADGFVAALRVVGSRLSSLVDGLEMAP